MIEDGTSGKPLKPATQEMSRVGYSVALDYSTRSDHLLDILDTYKKIIVIMHDGPSPS